MLRRGEQMFGPPSKVTQNPGSATVYITIYMIENKGHYIVKYS